MTRTTRRAACDGKPFQTVLPPAAAHYDARAVWLDGRLITDPEATGKRLHPVFLSEHGADRQAAQATFDAATGAFPIPPRTAVVFVEE